MTRMTPQEAGRKGGLCRSEKKRAAAARNGFQKTNRSPEDVLLANLVVEFGAAAATVWDKLKAARKALDDITAQSELLAAWEKLEAIVQ